MLILLRAFVGTPRYFSKRITKHLREAQSRHVAHKLAIELRRELAVELALRCSCEESSRRVDSKPVAWKSFTGYTEWPK
jgi:hypothetical protein